MKNYRIIHDRKEISSEESLVRSDFDGLISSYNSKASKTNGGKLKRRLVVFIGVVGLVFYGIFHNTYKEDVNTPQEIIDAGSTIKKDDIIIIPQIDVTAEEKIVENEIEEEHNEKPAISKEVVILQKGEPPSDEIGAVGITGFEEAMPIDGFPSLYKYFDEHLHYPDHILNEGIEGKVIVKFVIDTIGSPSDIVVEIPLHKAIDSVAVALVQDMPEWHPAKLNGKPISSTHRIPLFFQIASETDQ